MNYPDLNDFDQYQAKAIGTAIYPNKGNNFVYPALGLAGESGEVCEKVKKILRDSAGIMTPAQAEQIKKELGDVMWYVAALAYEIGYSLGDVVETNLIKLADRKNRAVLSGSGDNR